MPTPQAVIFDLGKVLLDFDYTRAIQRLLPRCRVSLDELRQVLMQDSVLIAYETGLVSTAEFFQRLSAATGYQDGFEDFSAGFGDIFTPIEPMIALHAEVRARAVPTYIFSNTNELAVRFIRARFAFFANFDGYVLSYEQRTMKPAPGMYEVAERLSGLHGPDLFYLDDRPENVEAGWQRGWQGVIHTDPAQSRAALDRTGIFACAAR